MQRYQSRIASVVLNQSCCWEVRFAGSEVVCLPELETLCKFIHKQPEQFPVLMDFSQVVGISFEALEYIASTSGREDCAPMAIVAQSGTIGEKYGHLLQQLNDAPAPIEVFTSQEDARRWLQRVFMA